MDVCNTKFYNLNQSGKRKDSFPLNGMFTNHLPIPSGDDSVWYVYTREQFVTPPLSKFVLNGQLECDNVTLCCVCVNPVKLPIQGLYAAVVVSNVSVNTRLRKLEIPPLPTISVVSRSGSV